MRPQRLALICLVGVGTCSSALPGECEAGVESVNGYLVVRASVNGEGPFRLLIDTGAARSVLTQDVTHKARLSVNEGEVIVVTPTGEIKAKLATARIRFGGSNEVGIRFIVHDLPVNRRVSGRLDGLVGQDFLSREPYLLDLGGKRLCFGEASLSETTGLGPETIADVIGGRIVIRTEIGGARRKFRLVLDSGTETLVLRCQTDCPVLSAPHASTFLTNSGSNYLIAGVLRHVKAGGLVASDVPGAIVRGNPDDWSVDGLLPLSVVSPVYVDAGRRFVRFRKQASVH